MRGIVASLLLLLAACASELPTGQSDPAIEGDPSFQGASPEDALAGGAGAGALDDVAADQPGDTSNTDAGITPDAMTPAVVPAPTEDSMEEEVPVPPATMDWVFGEPLQAPSNEQWTWIPLQGTVCADGSSAGVGVNFTSRSRDLVIFFQGNGVCYDLATCTIYQNLLVGMGPNPLDHMWWGDPNTGHLGIFDRNDAANPLRDSNYIVFPHCGVDGHTANKLSTYPPLKPIEQRGYRNVTVALSRIVPTFEDAGRVVVAGFSAGGIGSGANYHQIADAFAAAAHPAPFLIDDAGPVLRPPFLGPTAQSALRNGWGLDKTLEPWCPRCKTEGYHAVMDTIAQLHPGARVSVVAAYADGVATPLYGLLNVDLLFTGAKLEAGLRDLGSYANGLDSKIAPSVERVFYYPGDRHGALVVAPLGATPGLSQFLNAQLGGNPAWASVIP